MQKIRGQLKFEEPDQLAAGESVTIMVENTSRIDADSISVAKTSTTVPVGFYGGTDTLPFEVDVPDNAGGLSVRAHLCRHDGPDIRLGDMITTQALPVTPDEVIEATLRLVR